jgi:hypothetical protein
MNLLSDGAISPGLAIAQAMDGRAAKKVSTPLAVPRSTAERRSKRRMSEHRDVRVRRGRRSASIAGQSKGHDVRSTTATGVMVFGYFLP